MNRHTLKTLKTVLTALVLIGLPGLSCHMDSLYLEEIAQKVAEDEAGARSYTISYFGNNNTSGTAPIDSTLYHQGDTVEVLGNSGSLTRTNYTFGGWNTNENGEGVSRIQGDTFLMGKADVDLYAQWTINTPTVTFMAQGGSTPSPETKVVTYGGLYGNLSTTLRTGYSFDGWYDVSTGGNEITSESAVAKNVDHNLYAYWTAESYTLYFDEEGGSTVLDKSVTYDSSYGTLPDSSRSGYSFLGWWTGDNGTGSQVTPSTTVATTGNHTVYAKWSAVSYTVNFDEEGGSAVSNKTVTYDGIYGSLPTSTKTGYTFAGWWTGDNGTDNEVTAGTTVTTAANHYLYAKWNINSYTLTYNANSAVSGSTPTGSVFYTYGETVTVLDNTGNLKRIPTPAGTAEAFKFGGWNTQENGEGITYTAGNTFNMGASNMILYAKWVPFEMYDEGPGTGIIFYDRGSFSSGWRYLEAQTEDLSEGYIWTTGGDTQNTAIGTTSSALGAGFENSEAIVNQSGHVDSAAKLCRNDTTGGWSDWYLPSYNEVTRLYQNLYLVGRGDFDTVFYMSSYEYTTATGYYANRFDYGSWYGHSKSGASDNVRAVRRF